MKSIPEIVTNTIFPKGTQVIQFESYRPGYLEYPARVTVQTSAGESSRFVIKKDAELATLEFESNILRALLELGLPVPNVLAKPFVLEFGEPILVLSECHGQPLPWFNEENVNQAYLTCQLLIQGVETLHQLTNRILSHSVSRHIPYHSLADELNQIIDKKGAWFENDLYLSGVKLAEKTVPEITTPLAFSNGDYNPLNFLHESGELTGWIDFTRACFEDPYIGFAKFWLWSYDEFGWGLGKKIGLVERFLFDQGVSYRQFAPRLILRCLSHLQEGVSLDSLHDDEAREHMLKILRKAINFLEQ